jgi:hypothetical protein
MDVALVAPQGDEQPDTAGGSGAAANEPLALAIGRAKSHISPPFWTLGL